MGKGSFLSARSFFFWVVLLFFLDVATKAWALHSLAEGSYPLFADLWGVCGSLDLTFNTGVIWGLFAGYPAFWFVVRALLILALLWYVLRQRWFPIPLVCVMAGALGNTLDYVLYGKVIDFFHFILWGYSFPVFNCADIYVTLGILGFLVCPIKPPNGST